jgi:hypothetical protein
VFPIANIIFEIFGLVYFFMIGAFIVKIYEVIKKRKV